MSGFEDELEQKAKDEVENKARSEFGGGQQQGGGPGDPQQQGGGPGDQQQGDDPGMNPDQEGEQQGGGFGQ